MICGHGVAMRQLMHGGPGRASGGVELGGPRAPGHYLQRTAIQGHPSLLSRLSPEET
jgi:oxepin-CoA hydrolase / 3-oxo-5,6-dehydrosuberyl-CoA semialdehyde dehydrogenase